MVPKAFWRADDAFFLDFMRGELPPFSNFLLELGIRFKSASFLPFKFNYLFYETDGLYYSELSFMS